MAKYLVNIIQINYYFIYLPFYYALSNNFWSSELGDYDFNPTSLEDAVKTDKDAIKYLMERPSGDISFAIADPTSILEYEDRSGETNKPSIAVLAALLTNAAFWAIDHKTHAVSRLEHLAQFDKIIAYPQGTTSHRIASTINAIANNKIIPIEPVEPEKEWLRLKENKPEEKEKSFVQLTPDLVGLETTLAKYKDYKVELDIGNTEEYNEVLITALITRTDVIRDHEILIKEVLKGIQRACFLIAIDDEDAVKYYHDNYAYKHALSTDDPNTIDLLKKALYRAKNCRVFPLEITVTTAQWTKAGSAFWRANGRVSKENDERTNTIYQTNILPYAAYATNATKSVLNSIHKQNNLTISSIWRLLLSTMSNLPNYLKIFVFIGLLILAIPFIKGSYSIIVDLKNLVVTMNPPNPSSNSPNISPSPINSNSLPSMQEVVSFSMRLKWKDTNKDIVGAYITFWDGANALDTSSTTSDSSGVVKASLPRRKIRYEIYHRDLPNKSEDFNMDLVSDSEIVSDPEKERYKTKYKYDIPLKLLQGKTK